MFALLLRNYPVLYNNDCSNFAIVVANGFIVTSGNVNAYSETCCPHPKMLALT
jgi:hypothetical protein